MLQVKTFPDWNIQIIKQDSRLQTHALSIIQMREEQNSQ